MDTRRICAGQGTTETAAGGMPLWTESSNSGEKRGGPSNGTFGTKPTTKSSGGATGIGFATWRRAYRRIRVFDAKSVIVGPSVANFNADWLTAFLRYAKENGALPDIVSWHEMSWGTFGHRSIPAHVNFVRRFMAEHGISDRPIDLNEMIGPALQTNPGATVWFFACLEKAKVNGACHACWPDGDKGVSNCGNFSPDGLLTHHDKRPRSTWWAYKGYAGVTGRLVGLIPGVMVNGIAGVDAGVREIRAVIGKHGGTKR